MNTTDPHPRVLDVAIERKTSSTIFAVHETRLWESHKDRLEAVLAAMPPDISIQDAINLRNAISRAKRRIRELAG